MYYLFYLIVFVSHLYLFLVNPGVPNSNYFSQNIRNSPYYKRLPDSEKKELIKCDICNIIISKNDNVEHCDLCQICIKKYDHHCYWTGKCIGKNNIVFFFVFWIFSLIYIVWYGAIIIVWCIIEINGIDISKFN